MAKLLASNDEVEWADPQKHIFANEKHNKGADDQNKNAVVKQNGIWVFDGQFNLLALALILKRVGLNFNTLFLNSIKKFLNY